jgi:hypothetical protein
MTAYRLGYLEASRTLTGRMVRFTSDCELFRNFDVTGRVLRVYVNGTETVFDLKVRGHARTITVGSNMRNLMYDVL